MITIDELDRREVTEIELKDLLEKYEALYIEDSDKVYSDEYYELDLYLEARLSAIEEAKEFESAKVKALKAKIEELEAENRALYKRAQGFGDEYLSKKDIMARFSKGSDWALKMLKVMYQLKKAVKLGKEYYCKESDICSFMETYKGQEVFL